MRAALGLVLVFALAIGALAGVVALTGGPAEREDPTRPDQGALAPLPARAPSTREVARIGGGMGRVVDLAASQGALAVLNRNLWFIRIGDSLRGGFGDPTPGSPDWLSRPVSIALGEDRVYILDAGRHTLSVWNPAGIRREDIPLSTGDDLNVQPTQVLVGPGGEPVVLSMRIGREGKGRWEARAYGEGAPGRVVFSLEGGGRSFVFDRPYLATLRGAVLGINALTQAVFRVNPGADTTAPHLQRPNPPLWYVPRRIRESYDTRVLSRGGGRAGDLVELPPFWPSVRDFTVTQDGSFLLAITTGEERQHLELLDPGGSPLWRFNRDGFLDPVFLDGGRAFLVTEELNETVIHEFVFQSF
ncbi:MAG: hypothetical protein MUO50_11240 [Longimicrobiales bacterium]|nr:hypothetical protein [Longimicrobiales bacterium]